MAKEKKPRVGVCMVCGKEFIVTEKEYQKKNRYMPKCCSHACVVAAHKTEKVEKARQNRKHTGIYVDMDRPLTPDTAHIVKMWHEKGDSPELIAEILHRDLKQIKAILDGEMG